MDHRSTGVVVGRRIMRKEKIGLEGGLEILTECEHLHGARVGRRVLAAPVRIDVPVKGRDTLRIKIRLLHGEVIAEERIVYLLVNRELGDGVPGFTLMRGHLCMLGDRISENEGLNEVVQIGVVLLRERDRLRQNIRIYIFGWRNSNRVCVFNWRGSMRLFLYEGNHTMSLSRSQKKSSETDHFLESALELRLRMIFNEANWIGNGGTESRVKPLWMF